MARRSKITRIKWSEAEDRRLIDLISENGGNLAEAFRAFSEEFPARSFKSVQFRWYGVLKRKANVNVCLVTIDRKHKHPNSKIIKTPVVRNKMRTSIWKKILTLLGL